MMSKPVTFSVVRAKHDIIVNAALLREGLRRGKELYACRSAGGIRSKIAEVVILRDIPLQYDTGHAALLWAGGVRLLSHTPNSACPPATADFYCARSTGELMRDYADEIIRYVQKLMTGSKVSFGVEDSVAKEYERREASMKLNDFGVPRRNSLERSKLLLEATSSNPGIVIIDDLDEYESARAHERIECFSHVENESMLATPWRLEGVEVTVDDPGKEDRLTTPCAGIVGAAC